IYKAFENYNFSDELSAKVDEELTKANVTVVGEYVDNPIEEDDSDLPKNKDFQINNIQGIKISTKDRVADGVKTFLGTLGSSRMLTAAEEVQIAKLLGSKDKSERDYAVSQLVTSNLRLVTSIARRFLNRGLELEDLIQEGTMGLMKAINKFNYKLGNKFSTYAT
ncbi:MAG: sigma-70 family RNA polymerase sigma factor, partial [Mycoplasmoidaceae bacterium]|nr:sigma-70 family RNA polymerase sigma factor [Mycoplasmoidaceae bacterium]